MSEYRRKLLYSVVIVVPAGFLAKYAGIGWLGDYGAGMLYVFFWTLVFCWGNPVASPRGIAGMVFLVTCALEFLQLWHPAWLEVVRSTWAGRVLIGTVFSMWDFPFYLLGAVLGAHWASHLKRSVGGPEAGTHHSAGGSDGNTA